MPAREKNQPVPFATNTSARPSPSKSPVATSLL
jgi:hypothetical protein